MSSFEGHNISYAIEKIHDYINRSGSGYDAGWASTGAHLITEVLQTLETKMRDQGMNPEESEFPEAIYAIQELQKYVDNQRSNIADATEARIYTRALKADLDDLRRIERELDQAAS
jgi:hypothetical protein